MRPVPWSYVHSWNCIACGDCCKEYLVVLRFQEWLNIVKNYGIEMTMPSLNKFYLKKSGDGHCVFQLKAGNISICTLQQANIKPKACKLWPFKVHVEPAYGRPYEAAFYYGGRKFFVYVDPSCKGIVWGQPSSHFINAIVPEFIEIALGVREKQHHSTSKIPFLTFSPFKRGFR